MASAEFLEEALSSDVDENIVNALVGTIENDLVSAIRIVTSRNNLANDSPNQISSTTSENTINGQNYNTDRSDGDGSANSHRPTVVTYTNAPQNNEFFEESLIDPQPQNLPDSTITLPSECPVTENNVTQSEFKSITMQPPLVLKQSSTTGQVGIQSGMVTVPMTVNSSMAGSIPNVMTINKAGGQNVVVTTQNLGSAQPAILPNVQILNMRPGAPTVAAQKSVATVSPRVVIGTPQVVGSRATNPGITLQTLQSLQQGQQGHLLLKTENGQYQLLRVGPAPTSTLTAPQQTLRLSTVPAHPGVATVSTSVAAASQIPGQMPPAPSATPVPAASVVSIPTPSQPIVATQKPLDNTKEKCRNFFANLLDLSSKQPQTVETSVRNFIQELIDAQVEPEEFCDRLERLLDASPQPCLIGFLKKSLPLLRQSLVTKELVIEGINPPSPHVAFSTLPAPQAVPAGNNIQMSEDEGSSSPTLAALLPTVMPMFPQAPSPKPVALTMQNIAQLEEEGSSSPILTTLLPPVMPVVLRSTSPIPVTLNTQNVQQKPPPKPGSTIAVLQNIPVHTKINVTKVGKTMPVNSKSFSRPGSSSAALSTVLTAGKSLLKDKEKKGGPQFSSQTFTDDKMAGDDDINDVAAMGGVNLAEETQRILGSTDMIGTQIRSCKDEYLVPLALMQSRVKAISAKHGLEEPSPEVAAVMSHAVHERMKNLVEKLAVIAQHRIDTIKSDNRYEVTQDVKGQLKFLEELDKVDKKRREDSEREMLLRAAKSRSKNEDPEQAKLKAKAKEMQRAELEELRQREANLTALQAIGPRKKPRLDAPGGSGDSASGSNNQGPGFSGGRSQLALRTRLKRINHRDMIYLLEQENETAHSSMLFRSYLK